MTKIKQLLQPFPPHSWLQITLVTTSVRNGTALVCTFLPGLLNWSSFNMSDENFRPDAPECDNGNSSLGNPFSHRSEKPGTVCNFEYIIKKMVCNLLFKKKIGVSQEWSITVLSSIKTWELYYLNFPVIYVKTNTARLIFRDKIWGVAFLKPIFLNISLGGKRRNQSKILFMCSEYFNTFYKSVPGWSSKQKV